MNYRTTYLYVFVALVISMASINTMGQKITKLKDQVNEFRSPFRYVIVSNKLDPAVSQKDETRRFVEVLLDKKSFSKENLILLFRLISTRFPKESILFVNVYTDLEDIETPEERDIGKISELSGSILAPNPQDSAIFTRSRNEKNIIMNFANGDYDEIELK